LFDHLKICCCRSLFSGGMQKREDIVTTLIRKLLNRSRHSNKVQVDIMIIFCD
jgi:hypothetical protein